MLSSRLPALQLELHLHRHWLGGFLQHAQAAPFSTREQRHASLQTPDDGGGRSRNRPTQSSIRRKGLGDGDIKFRKHVTRGRDTRPKLNPIIADIRHKARAENSEHVIENYHALNDRDKSALESRDVRLIASCIHQAVRDERRSGAVHRRQPNTRGLVDFTEALVADIKARKLSPSGKAFVHVISLFKESGSREKGVQFWKWLVEQDESYVDVDCYGAAIELLAVDGRSLEELEKLYQEALGRFPGNFAAYHLSPNAVLPDREKPFTVGGIPISLLQGILTARLLNGDTRNAYLALDTAIRILPDQVPQRIFQLFIEERPLEEAYTVFALACRGGNNMTAAYYRAMLAALRVNTSLATPAEHALGVRAMLSATYMFVGAGGTVATNSVNELVIAASQFLRIDGVRALEKKDKQKLVKSVMDLIKGLFEVFARYGAKPGIPAFNSIITNLGGFGTSKQTIGIALKDADALGLTPTDVTWRSILAVGGMLGDKELVKKTWAHLRDSRIENETNPSASDFHAMVKPAHLAGAVDFALGELDKFRDVLAPNEYEGVLYRLEDINEAEAHISEGASSVNIDEVLAEVEKVKADIDLIKLRSVGNPTVQDFSEQSLPLTLQPTSSSLLRLPDEQMRNIYDAFTTTPSEPKDALSQPLPAEGFDAAQPTVAKSRTEIPFGTLRYENWKMVNFLLSLSEKNDATYLKLVDQAIASGKVAPRRVAGLTGGVQQGRGIVSWGLSSVGGVGDWAWQGSAEGSEVKRETEEVRMEVARLRERDPMT